MAKKNGFSLIELVIVIAVIGIIAAMVLPRFIDFEGQAIKSQESAITASLKEATTLQCMNNIAAGTGSWSNANPFTLVNPSAPNKTHPNIVGSQDGVNWLTRHVPSYTSWYIFCPHFNGLSNGTSATRGRWYIYCYGNSAPPAIGLSAGGWKLHRDFGH